MPSSSFNRPMTRSQTTQAGGAAVPGAGAPSSRPSHNTGPVTPPPVAASAIPQHITQMDGTPLVAKSSGTAPFTSNALFSNPKLQRMDIEMKSKFIGPMRAQAFLDQFLPIAKSAKKPWKWNAALKTKFQEVALKTKEVHMYQPLIESLEVACDGKLVLVNTSSVTDPDAGILVPEGLKPDISAYEPGYNTIVKKITNFSLMEVHMELKRNDADDGFLDDGLVSFENPTINGRDTRGQIIGYATAQLGLQFRTHIFSVLLCGTYARFIRWDRTGAIVSSRFNYTESDQLLQFFWRYGKMSSEARGKDLSVSRPTAEEELEARANLGIKAQEALLKFTVFDEDSKELRFFVGNEPSLKANSSATGRATRTYKVWDLQLHRPALLKDTWRVALPGMQKEGVIYKTLHEHHVPHISNILCSGDVLPMQSTGVDNHRTRTHLYADFITRKPNWEKIEGLKPHSHYRIVLDTIGNTLTTFKSSKELITAARDALEALFAAYRDARIMHRDISSGNIMITDDGGGLLIDWDLARAFTLDEITGKPVFGPIRQIERSGTWQFISVRLLLTSGALAHTLADDMESMLHVLSWIALRYMPHGLTPGDLATTLYGAFDAHHKEGTQWLGNRSKKTFLTCGEIGRIGLKNQVVADLLTDLAYVFAVQHEPEPPKNAFEKFKELESQPNNIWKECSDRDRDLADNARRYTRREKQRQDPAWMLKLFNDTLAEGPWPPNDAAKANILPVTNDNELKRKDPDDPEENERAKKQKTADGGELMISEVQSLEE